MSTKLKAVEEVEQKPGEGQEAAEGTEELPPLRVDATSFDARIAGIEPCSVVRELSKHHFSVAAYEVKQAQRRGEAQTYEESERLHREAWERQWEKRPEDLDELVELIKSKAAQRISWGHIGQVWNASPADAIELWRAIRLEARDEFFSGHYGARPFEAADWQREAWRRAQYLAVRDGLIEEWKPRGASEFILIDQMTQCYVIQLHWLEEAMKRAQGEPRVESYEFRQWQERQKAASGVGQWNKGDWDVPYQQEAEAVEQAFRLVELCMKNFQRAARQLANLRLVRAKTARAKRRDRGLNLKPVKAA